MSGPSLSVVVGSGCVHVQIQWPSGIPLSEYVALSVLGLRLLRAVASVMPGAPAWTDPPRCWGCAGGHPGLSRKLVLGASLPAGASVHSRLLTAQPGGRIRAPLADSIQRLPSPIPVSAWEPRLAGPRASPPGAAFSARLNFLPGAPGVSAPFPWPGMPSAQACSVAVRLPLVGPWGRLSASPLLSPAPCVQCSPVPDTLSLQDSQPPLSAVTRPVSFMPCFHFVGWRLAPSPPFSCSRSR